MPNVVTQDGFEVVIHTNDHLPPHVHVFRAEGEVLINIGDEHTMPSVRENRGMRSKDVRQAVQIVAEHQDLLIREWRRIHG